MSGSQSADSVATDPRKAPGNLNNTEEGSKGLSEEENMETSSCQDNMSGQLSDVNVTDSDKDDNSAATPSILKGEGDWKLVAMVAWLRSQVMDIPPRFSL